MATVLLTRSVRAEEIPALLEGSGALYLRARRESGHSGVRIWHPVTASSYNAVEGVTVRFGDGEPDVTPS